MEPIPSDRLVFAARALQFPATTGTQLRTQRLLGGLAEAFDTSLVTFAHHPSSDEGPTDEEALRRAFPNVHVVTVPGLGAHKRLLQIRSVFGSGSWSNGRYRSAAFRAALIQEVSRTSAALIHFDDAGSALNGPTHGGLSTLAPHDVQQRIARRIAASSDGLRQLFASLEYQKLRREEPTLWRRMDACIAISDIEARAMADAGAARVLMAPNGTDPVEQLPLKTSSPCEPVRLLFVGTGSFQPNEHGLAWFVEEVAPRLRGRREFALDIVGSPPRRPRRAPEVLYHGRVPEVGPYYASAHIAIIPIHFGGGSRLKALEAMAFGLPTVATSIGAEGMPIRPREHYLHADNPEDFAQAILSLASRLQEPEEALRSMVASARTVAESLFWPRIAARLAADYRDLLATTSSISWGRRRSRRNRR